VAVSAVSNYPILIPKAKRRGGGRTASFYALPKRFFLVGMLMKKTKDQLNGHFTLQETYKSDSL
jgi:hypothetical protein